MGEWLDVVVMGFIRTLYSDPAGTLPALHSFRRRLGNHLYETYTRARIEQLFNVIIEFPDSNVCIRYQKFIHHSHIKTYKIQLPYFLTVYPYW